MSILKMVPVLLFCTGTLLRGGDLPDSLQFSRNRDSWRWNKLKFNIESRYDGWKGGKFTLRSDNGTGNGGRLLKFSVDYAGVSGEAQAEFIPLAKDAFRLRLVSPWPEQVKPGLRYLSIELPLDEAVSLRIQNGGKSEELRFPARFGKMELALFTRSEGGEILQPAEFFHPLLVQRR